jgi:hypothetical protein
VEMGVAGIAGRRVCGLKTVIGVWGIRHPVSVHVAKQLEEPPPLVAK